MTLAALTMAVLSGSNSVSAFICVIVREIFCQLKDRLLDISLSIHINSYVQIDLCMYNQDLRHQAIRAESGQIWIIIIVK